MAEAGERGRAATAPRELGGGWKDVLKRVRGDAKEDDVGLLAAGVAFYAFFALFPALAAVVAIYGLVADPMQVEALVGSFDGVVPVGVQQIIRDQLDRLVGGSPTALGWGLGISLLLALWGASKGVRGLVKAMNVAYGEEESRGFVKRTAVVLLLTLGGFVAAVVAIALVAVYPAIVGNLGLNEVGRVGAQLVRWIVLIGLVVLGLAVLYRYGPSRDRPKWRWVTPGSVFAAVAWLLASLAFSIYVQLFGSYQETFGALAAVAILLFWFFLGALAIIMGAEINAEAELQTRMDTTAGPREPPGPGGAHRADTVGSSAS